MGWSPSVLSKRLTSEGTGWAVMSGRSRPDQLSAHHPQAAKRESPSGTMKAVLRKAETLGRRSSFGGESAQDQVVGSWGFCPTDEALVGGQAA